MWRPLVLPRMQFNLTRHQTQSSNRLLANCHIIIIIIPLLQSVSRWARRVQYSRTTVKHWTIIICGSLNRCYGACAEGTPSARVQVGRASWCSAAAGGRSGKFLSIKTGQLVVLFSVCKVQTSSSVHRPEQVNPQECPGQQRKQR